MSEQTPEAASPMASGTPNPLWAILHGPETFSVRVPKHDAASLYEAVRVLVASGETGDASAAPEAFAWLVSRAEPWTFRQHIEQDPWDVGCQCEDEDWFCPDGDGPPEPYYTFEQADVSKFDEMAAKESR